MNLLCRLGLHWTYPTDVTIPSFRRPGESETVCAEVCRWCSYVDPFMTFGCEGFYPGELLEDASDDEAPLSSTQPDTSPKETR